MNGKKINILFLGGAKRVSIAERFIEAGKTLGFEVSIFSYELNEDCPIAFVGTVIKGCKWSDKSILDDLKRVIKEYKIHILLPFVDPATIIAANLKNILQEEDVFIPVSDIDSCVIFFNKKLSNEWCIKNDIKVPDTNLSIYPLIAKPLEGSASKGIVVLNNESELLNLLNREKYLIQKFIKGNEYTIDIYRSPKTGKILSIVPRQRLETQGGESIKSITIKNENIEAFAKEVILKTNLIGAITLQILENEEKELFFMEINPRFGGGVLNSIMAGADSTMCLLKDFLGLPNSYQEWKGNFMMIRAFKEYYKTI
ncbi:ATP-grasp domain-containing protein [Capnocytophaga sp. Marseille-Q4570]|uniref:ATP-grasp domain-containing protein n=1 Tax=Capnocytophaga bilenii TaxID=2819369 RepID=A0ABS3PX85_9FLAO|nr:ATP-grasp domain-containing protein [Capnocytophaga bilenii]MBO1883912.1 ATP-grasp domain-containing protein [Capnocytophaga bilenii]